MMYICQKFHEGTHEIHRSKRHCKQDKNCGPCCQCCHHCNPQNKIRQKNYKATIQKLKNQIDFLISTNQKIQQEYLKQKKKNQDIDQLLEQKKMLKQKIQQLEKLRQLPKQQIKNQNIGQINSLKVQIGHLQKDLEYSLIENNQLKLTIQSLKQNEEKLEMIILEKGQIIQLLQIKLAELQKYYIAQKGTVSKLLVQNNHNRLALKARENLVDNINQKSENNIRLLTIMKQENERLSYLTNNRGNQYISHKTHIPHENAFPHHQLNKTDYLLNNRIPIRKDYNTINYI